MRTACLKYLSLCLLLFFLWCSGCAHHSTPVAAGTYSDPKGHFELILPWLKDHLREGGWQLLSWEDVDFVLWDQKTGATIVVNVTQVKEEVDLAILTRHLLIAFERKTIISQGADLVAGRTAFKTVLAGWVHETEIKAETYVVKDEGVVYDVIFWSPRDTFSRTIEQFHRFLGGINFLKPGGARE
jgi:hypothetical protein